MVNDDVVGIQSTREGDYGNVRVSHQSIANVWNEYLNRNPKNTVHISAKDVAVMMTLFKAMREGYKHKHDNLLDMASYAKIALEIAKEVDNELSSLFGEEV